MKAFYFATHERKLRRDDNRPIVVGETHTVDVEPIPCVRGLHASKQLLDALWYAPGSILYLVELGGQIVETSDKVCASSRTYLAEFDANQLLVKFACQCALEVVEQIRPYTKDYDLIVEFLKSSTDLSAADVARATARATARASNDAAYAAARAASYAVYATAGVVDVARAAARAARAAARAARAASAADAARVTRVKQNDLLTRMVKEATGWIYETKLESWLKERPTKIARSKRFTKGCRRMEKSSHGLDLRPYREPLSNEWQEGLSKARAQVSEIGAKH